MINWHLTRPSPIAIEIVMAKKRRHGSELLREWRIKGKLSQAKAAVCLGIAQGFVSRLEAGRSEPGVRVALLLQRKAGVPCDSWETS